MDARFVQAHKEARWALWLTLCYLAAWLVAAYLPGDSPGITGLPHWFEMACLLTPLVFIFAVLGDGEIHLSRYFAGG
ncbi:Membrane protein [Salmonella enterica subsp. enterica serovar Heidelberg]|nr:Membrane protein [Salmonella enterica subsp. enterica serovar Heidelberg]